MSERAPAPDRIRFPPGFVRRLEALVARLAAAREREEAAGRGRLAGAGEEFVGHRPYRPGEEVRHLDWNLFARLERPFVRVHRREAGERWSILLDTSASMGLGFPPKLQRAAEVATGLAFAGLREGAVVRLWTSAGGPRGDRAATFRLRVRSDLSQWLAFLESQRARGRRGLRELAAEAHGEGARAAARLFVVGDLLDLEPREALALSRRGRELSLVQILAPAEFTPPPLEGIEWVDPESGERAAVHLDAPTRLRYEAALERRLQLWRSTCAHHRASYGCWSSSLPFEDIVNEAL